MDDGASVDDVVEGCTPSAAISQIPNSVYFQLEYLQESMYQTPLVRTCTCKRAVLIMCELDPGVTRQHYPIP